MARPGMKVGPFEHRVQNDMLQIGSKAPDFKLTGIDYAPRTMSQYDGKVKIISCVPSVDTSVCSAQTRRFNMEAANLGNDVVILTISADLPSALSRYCATEGIDRTETLSDHLTMKFSDDYGVHDVDGRICQRAVFVLDKNNMVQYAEYMDEIGSEVNFEAALSKARELVGAKA
jgi:thioredoxin-dependent peroxiredoxin